MFMNNTDKIYDFAPMIEFPKDKIKRKVRSLNYCIKPKYRILNCPFKKHQIKPKYFSILSLM